VLEFVLRAGGMYFLALIMVRLLGKRALGELGPFDFVVMTGVGHTVVSIALDRSIPVYEGVIILATLAGLEYLMGYAALKNQRLSHLISGKPVILIDNGKIIRENLAREKFNLDDLLQELRKQGIRDIDEVDKGILESCGGFSVIMKQDDEPVTRRDLGLKGPHDRILTVEPKSRGDFFEFMEQHPHQADDGFGLLQILQGLEERMERIAANIDRLEKKLPG